MAVSVNTVYQTVLYILNKEQRGYVTPSEFGSIADLVQKEIFQSYFPDGNQVNRQNQNNTQNDTEFFNMYKDIAYKLYPFEKQVIFSYNSSNDCYYNNNVVDIYKIGEVITSYSGQPQYNSITQLVSKKDFDKITRSKLTAPTKQYPLFYTSSASVSLGFGEITNVGSGYAATPITGATTGGSGTGLQVGNAVYTAGSGGVANDGVGSISITNFGTGYSQGDIITISGGNNDSTFNLNVFESLVLKISPSPSATNDIVSVNCLTNPTVPNWDFTIGTVGQYIFRPVGPGSSSVNFQLDISEQNNLIINILKYFGVVINDPTIIDVAAQEAQTTEVNLKS